VASFVRTPAGFDCTSRVHTTPQAQQPLKRTNRGPRPKKPNVGHQRSFHLSRPSTALACCFAALFEHLRFSSFLCVALSRCRPGLVLPGVAPPPSAPSGVPRPKPLWDKAWSPICFFLHSCVALLTKLHSILLVHMHHSYAQRILAYTGSTNTKDT
jgi:hypothetical protein